MPSEDSTRFSRADKNRPRRLHSTVLQTNSTVKVEKDRNAAENDCTIRVKQEISPVQQSLNLLPKSSAPEGFCYALKFSRFGTHLKRLKDPDQPISLFIDRSARLGKHLIGPILVQLFQLPPKFDVNVERLRDFLQSAPKGYRWAVEFRDTRWFCEDVYGLLRAHNASICIHDHEDISCVHPQVLTADWIYLRFHGKNYKHCYNTEQLQEHASWIQKQLAQGLDVFAYFNNDYCGYAVSNAVELRELVTGLK